jgi:hypothetical protein
MVIFLAALGTQVRLLVQVRQEIFTQHVLAWELVLLQAKHVHIVRYYAHDYWFEQCNSALIFLLRRYCYDVRIKYFVNLFHQAYSAEWLINQSHPQLQLIFY